MLLRARSIAMEKKTGSIWMLQDVLARQHCIMKFGQYLNNMIARFFMGAIMNKKYLANSMRSHPAQYGETFDGPPTL